MSPLLASVHDPWLGLCLAIALGDRLDRVVTFGGPEHALRFEEAGVHAVLVAPAAGASTLQLLADPQAAAAVAGSRLVVFKPSRRLEERAADLGAELAHAPATVAQGLENKLALPGIAEEAGIPTVPAEGFALPAQTRIVSSPDLRASDLRALVHATGDVVVQSPRGYMGNRTWRVADDADWDRVLRGLGRRPVKVARHVSGRPGTVNAVVDATGATLVTAPIVQVTGEPTLTPFPMGSCGNDFTWRPAPHPGHSPAELVRRLGPVLAGRGYRGHFGIDFVVEDTPSGPVTWLIEINPRLTASMALYSAWRPVLAHAHLDAVEGRPLPRSGELPPLTGGQLIVHNTTDADGPALGAEEAGLSVGGPALPDQGRVVWPQVATVVAPGATRGRLVTPGVVVDAAGDVLR